MKYKKYAPIIHTALMEKYPDGLVEDYVRYCVDMGYSGISLEGKSAEPTENIDGWISDYIENVERIINAARDNCIDVWLFDEWGYPSGTAAGKVIAENGNYRSKQLRVVCDVVLNDGESVEFKINERFITASVWNTGRLGAVGAVNNDAITVEPEDGRIICKAKGGTCRLVAVGWDFTSGATHGVFRDRDEEKYGTIDLLSYEAVHSFINNMHERYYKAFGALFGRGLSGFFYDEPYIPYPFPYTEGIFEEFKKRKGYDIIPYLPQMLIDGWYSSENTNHILDYRDIVTARMADAFVNQIGNWCAAHGVMLTGHQDLDHSIRGLNTISGDFFRNSEKSDSPGVDFIWNQINRHRFCDYPRFAGSVKHLMNKSHASSESFAVTGSAMPADQMRWCMEHQIIRGIDLFYLMISEPETRLERTKLSRDNKQNIRFGRLLNERIAAVNGLAQSGTATAETAIYVPMSEVYIQGLKAGHPWMTSTMPHIWEQIDEIAESLCYMPCDYEYIWDGAVDKLPIEFGALRAESGQRIRTIIILGGINIPKNTIEKLNSFIGSGGSVIAVGKSIQGIKGSILIPSASEISGVIRPEIFKGRGRVSLAKRLTARGSMYFLLNESDKRASVECSRQLFEYSFERDAFDISVKDKELTFEPGELRIFSGVSAGANPSIEEIRRKESVEIKNWKMYMPYGGTIDIGSTMPDWRSLCGSGYSGGVKFEAEIELESDSEICIDMGHIKYAAVISIDGVEYKLPFSPYRLFTELKQGTYKIEMTVYNTEANASEQRAEQDSFYLAGGFDDIIKLYRSAAS